jgi:signal transduction histidine kinase
MGLGLFIAKTLIEAHRGRIWVESKIGHGTTFYFELSLEEECGEVGNSQAVANQP